MANPELKAHENFELIQELESRGLVVVAFCPSDVLVAQGHEEPEGGYPEKHLEIAGEWLDVHGHRLADRLNEQGMEWLGWADEIGIDQAEEDLVQ